MGLNQEAVPPVLSSGDWFASLSCPIRNPGSVPGRAGIGRLGMRPLPP